MGIRIRKMLGYGLFDLKHKGGKLVDPRLNEDSILNNIYDNDKYNKKLLLKYFKSKNKGFEIDLHFDIAGLTKSDWTPRDSFVRSVEGGMPNVLCIIPPSLYKEWFRYDDVIDYYEANIESKTTRVYQQAKLTVLQHGIYPWTGYYVDTRTGESLKELRATHASNYFVCADHVRDGKNKDIDLDKMAQKAGFQDEAELQKYMRPKVPDGVKALCQYGNLFKKEETIRELVPMMYTYWD